MTVNVFLLMASLVIISLIINIAAISLSHASEKPEVLQQDGFQAAPAYKNGFCGWATGGECKTDSDCIKGGCSAQVCQSGKKELSSQHASGENVIMPINTKSPANVLKADANGVKKE